jgi:hypothetical protein
MKLRLRTLANPKLHHLTVEQLSEAAANMVIEFDCNVKLVTFSPTPPSDTSIPWQPLDGCGGSPLGVLKTFRNGEWVSA